MNERLKWKRIYLSGAIRGGCTEEEKSGISSVQENMKASSGYLIARKNYSEEEQKDLLYRLLGPVFFGEKAAGSINELITLFRERYGIDVQEDFCEGDEHYEEYQEAQCAIAEGYSIYGGSIVFEDGILAELAEQVWDSMEQEKKGEFRRINTMLEE